MDWLLRRRLVDCCRMCRVCRVVLLRLQICVHGATMVSHAAVQCSAMHAMQCDGQRMKERAVGFANRSSRPPSPSLLSAPTAIACPTHLPVHSDSLLAIMLRALSSSMATGGMTMTALSRSSAAARPAALAFAPAAAAAASPSSVSSSASSSSLFFSPCRTVVVDRATRRVGRMRRMRRDLLRINAVRTRGSENGSRRLAIQSPPLAGMDASAANLHQFVSFLARQHTLHQQEVAKDAAQAYSLRLAKRAAAPAWTMTFADIHALMSIPQNQTFRACEEVPTTRNMRGVHEGMVTVDCGAWSAVIHLFSVFLFVCVSNCQLVGALSDPTTELGVLGLDRLEFESVLTYVSKVMRASLQRLRPEMLAARGSDFQHMEFDSQYEMAGAYAVLYLTAKLQGDEKAAETLLHEALANRILVPDNTPLGREMKKQ